MIISHKHRYLFIEIPHTGSTAIKHELCDCYDGISILKKHSFYSDFLKIATSEEKKYFVFAGIRNPLDEVVSKYFKLKTNHRDKYTDPNKLLKHRGIQKWRAIKMFAEIQDNKIDFERFFMKYYFVPYTNFASLVKGHYQYLIRFENLQEDFARALHFVGLEPQRPLPVKNSTKSRERDFWSYYTPTMIPRAKKVFGPFMQQWGYEFPSEWGGYSLSWWEKSEYELFSLMRRVKWKYFKWIQ
jgi:hypothetical protein